jgi:hypothetical protein
VTGAAEHNHWSGAGNEGFDANVAPMNEMMTFIDGRRRGGVGHHRRWRPSATRRATWPTCWKARAAAGADRGCGNHYVWSVGHPDWEVRFDMDKEAAAATRRELFGMLAADRVPFVGYHMPFPAMGYVEARGDGFRYVPVSYQMMLED